MSVNAAQLSALYMLDEARQNDPTTWDGIYCACMSFYDSEIHVAYVNHATARALVRRGLVEHGETDPGWGTELRITEAGRALLEPSGSAA